MSVDRSHPVWVATYGSYFSAQVAEQQRCGRADMVEENAEGFAEEAAFIADLALTQYLKGRDEWSYLI